MPTILQILFHLILTDKWTNKQPDFAGQKMGTQTVLVNLYRIDIPRQFCLTSNPVSLQLSEAVSCEKKKNTLTRDLLLWEGLEYGFNTARCRQGKKLAAQRMPTILMLRIH